MLEESHMPHVAEQTYAYFYKAFATFNAVLFDGQLPDIVLTLSYQRRAAGHFLEQAFRHREGITDSYHELSLNPFTFEEKSDSDILAILVHEMVHLWQYEQGSNFPDTPYHNQEWAEKMTDLGLMPSITGSPGGRQTGKNCAHYIMAGGRFEEVCEAFLTAHGSVEFDGVIRDIPKREQPKKFQHICMRCGQKAWGFEDAHLLCGACKEVMPRKLQQLTFATGSNENGILV